MQVDRHFTCDELVWPEVDVDASVVREQTFGKTLDEFGYRGV